MLPTAARCACHRWFGSLWMLSIPFPIAMLPAGNAVLAIADVWLICRGFWFGLVGMLPTGNAVLAIPVLRSNLPNRHPDHTLPFFFTVVATYRCCDRFSVNPALLQSMLSAFG
jgi:hypothetical protein